jgi:hypothetical protein
MPEYFLVSLFNPESDSHKPFYWMMENGEKWKHFLYGVLKPKHTKDIVAEVVTAEHPVFLDWAKTPLLDPESTVGWLTRCGRFYGCPMNHHDQLAYYVLDIKVSELESTGWVRIKDSRHIHCEKRMSEEQKNWLSHNGHKVYDSY